LSFGALLSSAQQVGDALDATVVNMRFVKPLDEALILELAQNHQVIVTLEENAVMGGAGEGVNTCLLTYPCHNLVINLGIPDHFVEHALPQEMLASCGLDPATIIATIQQRMKSFSNTRNTNRVFND
jgi:1-deoxy-D-xylulose-5-phosphate synthase